MTANGSSSYSLDGLYRTSELSTRGTQFYPLSWDQRHTVVINFDWAPTPWASIVTSYYYNSGLPYTLDKGAYTIPNDERMASTKDVNLRINIARDLYQGSSLMTFFEVTNLLNERNVLWVDSEGYPGGSLNDPGAYDRSRRYRIGLGLEF